MSKVVDAIEGEQLKQDVPDFRAGDTVVVRVRIREANRERLQAYEGVVIAKR
ncbi:MAG TPA: 50S ribosomal protein L19, partial [Gemmatimonadetes bacterium]|nr:50S ribosomal protein L19 [Gemmatimonadota bacterium]